jgi:hypothetical protein
VATQRVAANNLLLNCADAFQLMESLMELILIVVLLVLLFGGGGYYGRRMGHW